MVSFFCPFCKHVMKAAEDAAGTLIACDQCKLEIRVPQSTASMNSNSNSDSSAPQADGSAILLSWWKRLFEGRGRRHPRP